MEFYEDFAQLLEIGKDTLIVSLGDAHKEIFIEITDMLGINQNDAAEFIVYPNPAENFIYVTSSHGYQVMLYTTDGRLVSQSPHHISGLQPIDLTDVSSGIYFLRIISDDGISAIKKIVVEK